MVEIGRKLWRSSGPTAQQAWTPRAGPPRAHPDVEGFFLFVLFFSFLRVPSCKYYHIFSVIFLRQ